MEKKYSLTNESKIVDGYTVYRIIAEKDFGGIKKGTLGGFVASENNLSHDDNCWIYYDATVYGNARVLDNAIVSNNVKIFDSALICDNAVIYDDAQICGRAKISDNAAVYNNAQIFGNAKICDYTKVYGDAAVSGRSFIYGSARVYGNAIVCDSAIVGDNARIYGFSRLYDNAIINQEMWIENVIVSCALSDNLAENIRCQTGLGVFNNKIIAYKQINKDMSSFYDSDFKYEVGKVIEVKDADMSNKACASGLHFSNMNYWNWEVGEDTGYLMAEIDIKDIITVQQGKIRCKRAKILGTYNI
jgi:carbonic anhydrase/acetyltransferase-like protein (isoleucine patch superfamily)